MVQQALQLTEQICTRSHAADWQAVAPLVRQRQSLLEQIFQANLAADELHMLIEAIRERDQQVTDAVTAARDQTMSELQQHQHKAQATQAYAAQQPHIN